MAFFQFKKEQKIKSTIDDLWEFISTPENLKLITPPNMEFNITSGDTPKKMYEGMIISYTVRPILGIKMNWVTEITHLKEKKYFVDEQRIGPYAMWHHQHILESADRLVIMKDIVTYKPPFGLLGAIANKVTIEKKLNEIFEFREMFIANRFD